MPRSTARRRWSWIALILVFVALHVVIGLYDGYDEVWQVGSDVYGLYDSWVFQWQRTGVLVGVGADSVYPLLALGPIIAAAAFGTDPAAYFTTWMLLVLALDLVALVLLARRRMALAWWWVGFTALLGPVSLARLDTVALAVVIPGVLVAADRPAIASAVFSVAAWIKIWPAALVLALVLAMRRAGRVLLAAASVTAAVAALALLVGAGPHLLSSVTAQTGRGIQVEAPVALPWLWIDAAAPGRSLVQYDEAIFALEVRAPGVAAVAGVMTPVLAAGVLVVVVLALVARRRGVAAAPLLACTALGLVAALIALNKVGSPQYVTWYAAPVLLGLLADRVAFRTPAVLVLVLAGLTGVIYPWLYDGVYDPALWVIAVLTVRNALEIVLLGWALVGLVRLRSPIRMRTGAVPVQQPAASR